MEIMKKILFSLISLATGIALIFSVWFNKTEKNKESETENSNIENTIEETLEETHKETMEEEGPIVNFKNPFANVKFTKEEEERLYSLLPEELKKQADKYPEARSSLLQYEKYKDDTSKIDISKEIRAMEKQDRGRNKIPYFNQWDVRWAFRKIDNGNFAVSGCGPTVMSMAYIGLTGDDKLNPYAMGQLANEGGYYVHDLGSYHTLFTEFANKIGMKGMYITPSFESLKAAIDRGSLVMLHVKHNGIGDFTYSGHYILATDYDEDGQVTILDPNSYNNTNKKWDFDRILSQTANMFEISKQ